MPRLMTILIVLTALSLTALGGCGPIAGSMLRNALDQHAAEQAKQRAQEEGPKKLTPIPLEPRLSPR